MKKKSLKNISLLFKLILFISVLPITPVFSQLRKSNKVNEVKGATKAFLLYNSIMYNRNYLLKGYHQNKNILNSKFILFEAKYRNAAENSKEDLKKYFKDFKEAELLSTMYNFLDSHYKVNIVDESMVDNYIKLVDDLITGQSNNKDLIYLLHYKYKDNPVSEMIDGYTYDFYTKDHPKAKGTNWKIKLPITWFSEEGERPNIIQKFTNQYGNGDVSIFLSVKELGLPKSYKFTKKDYDEMNSLEYAKSIVPHGDKFISHKKITIENIPASFVEYETKMERMEDTIYVYQRMYYFLYNNKFYSLSCLIGNNNKDKIYHDLLLNKDIFYKVANSIVLLDKY